MTEKDKRLMSRLTKRFEYNFKITRLYARYLELCEILAELLAMKASGKDKEALEAFVPKMREFGKYELEMERVYDHTMCYRSWHRLFGDFDNPTV